MIEHAELTRLWPLLKAGDSQAQKTLFDKCYPDIAAYVIKRSRSKQDAEEIISHTFTRCLKEIARLIKQDQFRFWLYQLANRCLIDYYRKKREEPTVPLSQEIIDSVADSKETDPVRILLRKEWFEQFYKVLDKLSANDRDYITSLLEGMSLSDMAIIRGKKVAAIKEGIHRARIRLAKILTETPYFGDMPAVGNIFNKFGNKDIK
jgi:RNA polymerase sigma-70 factor (ECF subfamily)